MEIGIITNVIQDKGGLQAEGELRSFEKQLHRKKRNLMENKLPKPARKTCQKKQAVTIAEENADIVIREFPYQI